MESGLILCSQAGLATKGKKEQIIHSRGPHTQPKYVCPKTSFSWPYCCPPASLRLLSWELFVFQHHWDQERIHLFQALRAMSFPFQRVWFPLCRVKPRWIAPTKRDAAPDWESFSSWRPFSLNIVLPLCPSGGYLGSDSPLSLAKLCWLGILARANRGKVISFLGTPQSG